MPIVLPASSSEAGRNLALGVVLVLVALPVAGMAFLWAPRESFVAISTALLISLLVFLFFQLRWVSQRNGLFALLCAGFLVTLSVPILVKIAASSTEWAEWLVSLKQAREAGAAAGSVEGEIEHDRQAQKAARATGKSGVPASMRGPSSGGKTAEASALNPAEAESRIVSGSAAAAPASAPVGATVADKAAAAPRPASAPVEETLNERVTRQAKEEALRRYPKLAEVGSAEHSRYIQTFNDFRRTYKHEFFAEPNWPLNLAELLAKSDGWKRADGAEVPAVQASSQTPSVSAREEAIVRGDRNRSASEASDPGPSVPAGEGAASADGIGVGKAFGLDLPDVDPSNPNSRVVVESLEEVRRRYPPMAQLGSVENRVFVESVQEYERLRPEFFESPRWPVRLADLVAKRMGWKRMEAPGAAAGER